MTWRVYDERGRQLAVCDDPIAAAAIAAFFGEGTTIYSRRRQLWHEGTSGWASESANTCAQAISAKKGNRYLRGRK